MIVVTGATGHVGGLVAERLATGGHPMRLAVRDSTRAPRFADAQVVTAGYEDPAALATALRAGDRVFMVSMHQGPERRIELHRSFVEAAARQGVAHVVYLSFLSAGPGAVFSHARSHGATEEMLERSGVPFTSVRGGMYADDIPGWFDQGGVNRVPGGTGRMSFSYRPELADVIVAALTEPGHDGKVYDIATRPSVSMAELALAASEVTGGTYRWEPNDDGEWEAGWRARNREEWQVQAGLTSHAALRSGEFDVESHDYRIVTGRDPLTIQEVIARLSTEMPLSNDV